MAFTAKILSWHFRHLNIVGCLLKRRPTKEGGGGHGHPRTPLATPLFIALSKPHPQPTPVTLTVRSQRMTKREIINISLSKTRTITGPHFLPIIV